MGTAQVQIWNVPYPRNPLFTGRAETLKALHETLASARVAALTQPQAISGLGGIGKTQTAIEYAYRHADQYQAILWVGADTPDVFTANLAALAKAEYLNLPEQKEQDQSLIVNGVIHWLQTHANWLLILDNCELDRPDTATLIRSLLAQRGKGDLLLTTRAQATGSYIQRVSLDRLSEEEGTLFLLRRTKRLLPTAFLPEARATDSESARAIVQAVGGLPLALDQAGAYVEEKQCDLAHYLRLYHNQKERGDLLQQRGGMALDHLESVTRTFSLSFEQIEQTAPMAGDLLRVCALLYAEEIPEAIFVEGASHLGPTLQALTDHAHALDSAMAILSRYSLIQRESDHQTLSLHRVVQAVLQTMMEEDEQRHWAERVIGAVDTTFPEIDHTTWAQCQRYLPHALACADLIETWKIHTAEAASLLHQAAYYLVDRAQYPEAEPLYQRALAIREQVLGPEHPDTATSLNNLAILYYDQGKYGQAEPLYQRALTIIEKALGPDHPDTITVRANYANLLKNMKQKKQ